MATLAGLKSQRLKIIGERKKLRINNPNGVPRSLENRMNQELKRLDFEIAHFPKAKKSAKAKDPLG